MYFSLFFLEFVTSRLDDAAYISVALDWPLIVPFFLFFFFFCFCFLKLGSFIPLALLVIVTICLRGLLVGYGALYLEFVQRCPDE